MSSTTDPSSGNQTPRKDAAQRLLKITVIVAALGLSLWYALRGVEWDRLWEALGKVNGWWILASVISTMLAHLTRAERWRILIPGGLRIGLINSYSAVLIGYMLNNIIPRAGELLRPYVLAKRERRSFSSLLATVLVERILDGITLASLFVLLLFIEHARLEQLLVNVSAQLGVSLSASGVLLTLAAPILGLIVMVVVAVYTSLGDRMVGGIERIMPGKGGTKIRNAFEEFRAGVNFSGPAGTARIAVWSIIIWGFYALSIYCGFLAFGFDTTYGMGFRASIPVLAVTTVGITIAPTPGAFGVYHVFSKVALVTLYGVTNEDAVAFALALHAAPYLATLLIGGLFFLREGVSLGEARRNVETT